MTRRATTLTLLSLLSLLYLLSIAHGYFRSRTVTIRQISMASNRNIRSARSTRRFEREDENSESDKELDQRFSRESANNKIQEQLTPLLSNLNSHWQQINKAIVAGIFIAGIGAGITIDSAINTNPKDLASRDAIDKNAPNPKLCAKYGSSAMVFDQRVFITFNPFNIYVSQADTKPGCVLRPANVVSQLQRERNLLTDEQVNVCKDSFNTWAYVGDINDKPQLSCVYQSEEAQNEFLSNPKVGLGEDVYDEPLRMPKSKPTVGRTKPEPATARKGAKT